MSGLNGTAAYLAKIYGDFSRFPARASARASARALLSKSNGFGRRFTVLGLHVSGVLANDLAGQVGQFGLGQACGHRLIGQYGDQSTRGDRLRGRDELNPRGGWPDSRADPRNGGDVTRFSYLPIFMPTFAEPGLAGSLRPCVRIPFLTVGVPISLSLSRAAGPGGHPDGTDRLLRRVLVRTVMFPDVYRDGHRRLRLASTGDCTPLRRTTALARSLYRILRQAMQCDRLKGTYRRDVGRRCRSSMHSGRCF